MVINYTLWIKNSDKFQKRRRTYSWNIAGDFEEVLPWYFLLGFPRKSLLSIVFTHFWPKIKAKSQIESWDKQVPSCLVLFTEIFEKVRFYPGQIPNHFWNKEVKT